MLFYQAALAPPDLVAGTVLSERDQRPISRATVILFDDATSRTLAQTRTDDAGHYQLPPVPPGKYSLTASARGYLTGSYLHHDTYATAIVTGAGLATSALTLTLTPAATISGMLTDDADPVLQAKVELYREDPTNPAHIHSFRNITANDSVFEFTDLPPGRYYLSASAIPWYVMDGHLSDMVAVADKQFYRSSIDPALNVIYPTLFYPDALDSSAAQPLVVHPGEQITANLRMRPQAPVSLTLHLPPNPEPHKTRKSNDEVEEEDNRGSVNLTHMVFGQEESIQVQFEGEHGTLTSSVIPPGRYFLSQSGPGDSDASVRVGEVDLTGATTVLTLAPLKPQPKVTLQVHGLPPRKPDSSTATAQLKSIRDSDIEIRGQNLDEKALATFPSLPPGTYRPVISTAKFNTSESAQHDLHISSVTVNGRAAPDQLVHLTGAGKTSVVVVVSTTHTTVQGLALKEGKPAPGIMIVLVPAGPDAHPELFRRDQSDLDGTFNLLLTEPGKYILVAIEDGWPLRWDDPTTLAPYLAHGLPVTIPATVPATYHLQTPIQTIPR